VFVVIGDVEVLDGFPEFSEATEALVAQVRGQRVSVVELYQLAAAIEDVYRNEGYILVRVAVPPQSLGDGETFRLQVVDGFIESIDVDGVPARARRALKRQLEPLVGQRRLKVGTVERLLTLAGRAPGLRLRSTLDAGEQVGGVRLILDGDHEPFGSAYSTNNRLSESLGRWDHTLRFALQQPLSQGEQVYAYLSGGADAIDALTLEGKRRVVGGGVTLPLGHNGWSLNLEFTGSKTSTDPPAAWVPRLESRFERYSLRLSYPLVMTRRQSLTLTGALEVMDQQDSFPDFGHFVLSSDRLRVLRLGVDGSRPFARGLLSWNASLSRGIDGLGARDASDAVESGIGLSRPGADPDFLKLDTSLFHDLALPKGWAMRSTLRGQIVLDGTLPSAELFSLEGEQGLSTFTSGALASDAGWTMREELLRPMSIAQLGASPYLFAAFGRLRSRLQEVPYGRESIAYGIGLRAFWRSFDIAMEYGRYDPNPGGRGGEKFFVRGGFQF